MSCKSVALQPGVRKAGLTHPSPAQECRKQPSINEAEDETDCACATEDCKSSVSLTADKEGRDDPDGGWHGRSGTETLLSSEIGIHVIRRSFIFWVSDPLVNAPEHER